MARSAKAVPKRAARGAGVAGGTLYLVQRLYEEGWDSIFGNSAAAFDSPERPGWGGPVKAFTTRFAADALCRELHAKLLDGRNPFEIQGEKLADLTSFPPGPFRDWLLDVGLKPPAGKDSLADWRQWWEKGHKRMNAEQRHRLLTALDRLRLYGVAELEPPARSRRVPKDASRVAVFTVGLLKFKDDDDFLASLDADWAASLEPCFSVEGLRLATFRDRDQAVAYRDDLQSRVPGHSRAFYRNGFGVGEHTIEVGD